MNTKYNKTVLNIASKAILSEQGGISPIVPIEPMTPELAREFWNSYKHEIMMVLEIGTLIIPTIGPFISAGIGALDAKMYWDEGDRYTAGLMATLTAIPLIGSLAKLGLKPLISSLGKNGLKKFISKLKLAKSGSKPAFTKTESEIIKKMGKDGAKEQIKREVAAYYERLAASKAGKVVGKTASAAGKTVASIVAAKKMWDPMYKSLGLDIADIESAARPILVKIKNAVLGSRATPGVAALPKYKLEQIIREELIKLNEANIPNQAEGDAFRKWLRANKPNAARQYDIDPTGPWNSKELTAAYQVYAAEFKRATAKNKEYEDFSNSWAPYGITATVWALYIGLGILAVKTGKKGINLLIRKAMPFIPFSLLEKIIGKKVSAKQLGKMSSKELKAALQKMNPDAVLTNEEVNFIRAELNKLNDPQFYTKAIQSARKNYFDNFLLYGGQSGSRYTETVTADMMIQLMTSAERKEFGEYVLAYQKQMGIDRWKV